jgi:hypothetical protein
MLSIIDVARGTNILRATQTDLEILKLDESCTSNPKSEISIWTVKHCGAGLV